jgi:hypothetical protein
MNQLETADFQLLKEYNQMLEVMQEGFDYVSGPECTPALMDKLLSDIFFGMMKISESNVTLSSILKNDQSFEATIEKFNSVVAEVQKLEDQYNDRDKKSVIVINDITPVFLSWKEDVQQVFERYLSH